MKSFARSFMKGLFILVPIAVTIYVIYWLGASAEALLGPPLQWLLVDTLGWGYFPGLGVLLAAGVVLLIGLLARIWLFERLFELPNAILANIPLIKSVFRGLQDLMHFMSQATDESTMHEVVRVTLPDGMTMLGFVTQADSESIPEALRPSEDAVAVYLPMSYQLGGFTIFVSPAQLETVEQMSIEDAMRYAITAGMSTKDGDEVELKSGSPG